MDFQKFTEKCRSFMQAAQTLAMRSDHQSLEPEHLLKVMLEDDTGAVAKLLSASGADLHKLQSKVNQALSKLVNVTGSGAGGLRLSTDLIKILDKALQLSEKSGDKFVTSERILQSMLIAKATNVAEIMADSGLTDTGLNAAINDMRKGKTADNANAEDNFDALAKYARDLT
ncbi:MAG: Clp protease N-terminal domain-containing protein, partial [Pseudomonadota bacterium]|nr:Clp protease N-terminal domain-containing protein [Pseudomonadota bacterium]